MPLSTVTTAEELVRRNFAKRGFSETITAATRMEDLGADSLTFMEIVMGVEAELGVEICDEDIEKVVSVGDFIELVKRYSGAKLAMYDNEKKNGRMAQRA
jgi:acyl carrier protein